MRLLYAEDERDLNEVVTRTLLKNHYSVDSCFDGEEALDCLAAAENDAVILDIMMPRVDGLTVLSRLRARGNRVPVCCSPRATASPTASRAWIPARTITWSSPLRWRSCWRGSGRCSGATPAARTTATALRT